MICIHFLIRCWSSMMPTKLKQSATAIWSVCPRITGTHYRVWGSAFNYGTHYPLNLLMLPYKILSDNFVGAVVIFPFESFYETSPFRFFCTSESPEFLKKLFARILPHCTPSYFPWWKNRYYAAECVRISCRVSPSFSVATSILIVASRYFRLSILRNRKAGPIGTVESCCELSCDCQPLGESLRVQWPVCSYFALTPSKRTALFPQTYPTG